VVAVNTDATKGITDRLRSLPISSLAVVGGRGLADLAFAVFGLAAVIACGLAIGWSWQDGLANAALAVVLLFALRFALIWAGIYLGLAAKDPQEVVAVQSPGLARGLPLQRLCRAVHHAHLAWHDRRMEPDLLDRHGSPRALRQFPV
jgi:hypothetical protein